MFDKMFENTTMKNKLIRVPFRKRTGLLFIFFKHNYDGFISRIGKKWMHRTTIPIPL